MTTATGPTRLVASQLPEAGAVLGRALYDDPMMVYLIPADATRERVLPWFMGAGARYGHLFGEVYTTENRVEGAAVWLPPGSANMSPLRMLRAGMLVAPFRLGLGAFRRFMSMVGHFEKLEKRDMPTLHWQLALLGVEPTRQGQGIGSSLLGPVLTRADAEGTHCYLETTRDRNVPFYQKHGFEVVVEDDLPNGELHFWTMKRNPGSR